MSQGPPTLSRSIAVAIVAACAAGVAIAALIQQIFVLGMTLSSLGTVNFLVPVMLGTIFGLTIVGIRRALQRERHFRRELAERERALADLNRDLERRVVERTRDLESAIEQLVHAQRMEAMGRVAGSIAHDFNNMLTVVFACAFELRKSAGADPRLRTVLSELDAACEQARQITRQLLIYSRRERPNTTRFRLRAMIEDLRPILARVAGTAVLLKFEAAGDPEVQGDRGQLQQVVVNLLINARDAGSQSVVVGLGEVAAGESGRRLALLSVRDDGCGMDAETAKRALEPFFTTKPAGQGTGLGLSVADSVVRTFGGSLDLASTAGAGTTVTLRLPAADQGSSPPGAGHPGA